MTAKRKAEKGKAADIIGRSTKRKSPATVPEGEKAVEGYRRQVANLEAQCDEYIDQKRSLTIERDNARKAWKIEGLREASEAAKDVRSVFNSEGDPDGRAENIRLHIIEAIERLIEASAKEEPPRNPPRRGTGTKEREMSKRHTMFVCSFTTTDELKGRSLTYENVRAVVLKAGRFSVFEATETPRRARLFDQLARDPSLTLTREGFPWTGVKERP